MLSVRTMQNVVRIQNIGNVLGVDPIKMNTNGLGAVESCTIIYSSKYWKIFMICEIGLRILFPCIGIFVVHNPELNTAEKAMMLLLMLLGYMSAGLQLLNLVRGEDLNTIHNQVIHLNLYLRKHKKLQADFKSNNRLK